MPLSRLIDGTPEDSGQRINHRTTWLMLPALVIANGVGAFFVFIFAGFIVPSPEGIEGPRELAVNAVALSAYLVLALVVGVRWGFKRLGITRRWLAEERAPDERELKIALRGPRRILVVHVVLWGLAVVVFAGLNAAFSPLLGLIVAAAVTLGGAITSAIAYLLTERILRATFARALAHGAPSRPVLAGVATRAMLAWALGSGVPLVGLALVAVATLTTGDVSDTELANTVLGFGALALTVGILITYLTARATADPVLSVRRALGKVESGDLDVEVPVYDGSELGLLQAGFNRMAAGLREREKVRDLFGRHVGEDVARAALEQEVELGGEVIEAAVLFVDIEHSTELAAERPPAEVVSVLNSFFSVVIDVVDEHGGFVNKFEGDAALAVFGAPIPRGDAAACALAAARTLAVRLEEKVPDISAGIGVSGGEVVAGNVGDETRFEYTVIGDPVNEAARLTELAKERKRMVLASANLVDRAGEDEARHWQAAESVELRGRARETRLAVPS